MNNTYLIVGWSHRTRQRGRFSRTTFDALASQAITQETMTEKRKAIRQARALASSYDDLAQVSVYRSDDYTLVYQCHYNWETGRIVVEEL